MTLGIPSLLVTATGAFGLLLVGALPLLVRLPFRAARGDVAAIAAVVGLLALAWVPVSLSPWAVLPARFPRYALALMPALFLAVTSAWTDRPRADGVGRVERACGLLATAATLLVVSPAAPWTWCVPVAAALAAFPLWPELPRVTFDGNRIAAATAGAGLVLSVAAWKLREPVAPVAIVVLAALIAVTVVLPLRRRRGGWCELGLPCAAFALAAVFVCARFVPDKSFSAWSELPATGVMHAERVLVRRLRITARDVPGADPARLRVWEPDAMLELEPNDRLLVRMGSPALDRAERLPGLVRLPPRLDEAVLFGPDRQ